MRCLPPKRARAIFSRISNSVRQIRHATPRTVTLGDVALYNGLFGARFAVQSSDVFAQKIGYPRSPLDDLLVFHVVFGKTVAGYLAQRRRQSRLRGLPVSQTRLSRRHADRRLRGHRAAGKFQQEDRHCLCALARVRRDRRYRARLRALGDGAQTRRGSAQHRPRRSPICRRTSSPRNWARRARKSILRPTTRRLRAVRIASATIRPATKSTTSTGSRSRRPSTRLPRGSIRTLPASISISSPRARAVSGAGSFMAVTPFRLRAHCHSTALQTLSTSPRSMAGGTLPRCLPATRSLRGQRCWPAPTYRIARMSARCACARSRPRIGRARTFRSRAGDEYDPAVILDLDYWVLMPR